MTDAHPPSTVTDTPRVAAGRTEGKFNHLRHTGAVLAAQSGATLAGSMGSLGHTNPATAMSMRQPIATRPRKSRPGRLLAPEFALGRMNLSSPTSWTCDEVKVKLAHSDQPRHAHQPRPSRQGNKGGAPPGNSPAAPHHALLTTTTPYQSAAGRGFARGSGWWKIPLLGAAGRGRRMRMFAAGPAVVSVASRQRMVTT